MARARVDPSRYLLRPRQMILSRGNYFVVRARKKRREPGEWQPRERMINDAEDEKRAHEDAGDRESSKPSCETVNRGHSRLPTYVHVGCIRSENPRCRCTG